MFTLAGGLLDIGGKLIDKLIPDPEAKAKAQQDLLAMQQKGELAELETRMSAIMAEAQSSDPWTSRARPSFMYVFYFMLVMLVIVAPFVGVFFPEEMMHFYANVKSGFQAIPEELWWTFGTGYLGYGAFRTIEKRKGMPK
jgi:Holin of 3TMs, for gene-transfer release